MTDNQIKNAVDSHQHYLKNNKSGVQFNWAEIPDAASEEAAKLLAGQNLSRSIISSKERKAWFGIDPSCEINWQKFNLERTILDNSEICLVDMQNSEIDYMSLRNIKTTGLKLTVTPALLTVDFTGVAEDDIQVIEFYDTEGNRVYNIKIDSKLGFVVPCKPASNHIEKEQINWKSLVQQTAKEYPEVPLIKYLRNKNRKTPKNKYPTATTSDASNQINPEIILSPERLGSESLQQQINNIPKELLSQVTFKNEKGQVLYGVTICSNTHQLKQCDLTPQQAAKLDSKDPSYDPRYDFFNINQSASDWFINFERLRAIQTGVNQSLALDG